MSFEGLSELLEGRSAIDKERFDRFVEAAGTGFFRSFVRNGIIVIEKTSVEEARVQFALIARQAIEDEADHKFVIDYRERLLKCGRAAFEGGDETISCILYATWLEHWVNDLA